MRKSLFHVLGATAALGAALFTTTAASAAPHARADPAATVPSDTTIVTFTVNVGNLNIAAPPGATLNTSAGPGPGAFLPGDTISGGVGPVTVSDNRALLAAAWTASASSTDFTTGAGSPVETIPAGDATYDAGTSFTNVGIITTAGSKINLSSTPQTVVRATAGVGDNSAQWFPTEAVAVPASAVGGAYTSVLTESVL